MQQLDDDDLPPCIHVALMDDLLAEVLVWAGAWRTPGAIWQHTSAWSVCRAWRDCVREANGQRLARLLVEVHGPEAALIRAVRCTSQVVDGCVLVRQLLEGVPGREQDAPLADYQCGRALLVAARGGH